VLEIIFRNGYHNENAHTILQIKSIKEIVKRKWKAYRYVFTIWMLFHLLMMILLTLYAIKSADVAYYLSISSETNVSDSEYLFVEIMRGLTIFLGIAYLSIALLAVSHKVFRPKRFDYVWHNLHNVLMLFIFGCCAVLHTVNEATNVLLTIAVIMGWSFMTFFLAPFKKFSYFTEMLKRVIFGDILAFSVIIAFQLLAFSVGIYIMFKTEQFNFSYPDILLIMFKLMIGIGDLESLELTQIPWFSYSLFIVFVLMTYILLFNALIGMMSETCASLNRETKHDQWRIEQVSVILFLEDTFFHLYRKEIWDEQYVNHCIYKSNQT